MHVNFLSLLLLHNKYGKVTFERQTAAVIESLLSSLIDQQLRQTWGSKNERYCTQRLMKQTVNEQAVSEGEQLLHLVQSIYFTFLYIWVH